MGQITYNFPAMLATAGEMHGHNTQLRTVGTGIAAEQSSLAANWQGDTGQTYQAWQQQWNQALEEATQAYQAMTQAHEQNTMNMMGRDRAEGSKWG